MVLDVVVAELAHLRKTRQSVQCARSVLQYCDGLVTKGDGSFYHVLGSRTGMA